MVLRHEQVEQVFTPAAVYDEVFEYLAPLAKKKLALELNLAVWSNDNDFEDAGVEWHTTAELLKALGIRSV